MITPKNMLKNIVSTTVLSSALLFSGMAHAQLEQQTGVADPGRIGQSLSESTLIPQVSPNVSVKQLSPQNAPEGAENIKFNFGGLKLDGVETYNQSDLLPLYQNKIGTEISLADLYAIANSMTLKYRNDGYVLTQVVVPPQTIENGIARLLVVEGFIDNVIIQGGDEGSSALKTIQEYAKQISPGGALNIADMERYLLLINDLPGLNARSVISPSASTPGAADILIIVERTSYEALVGINNHGSRYLGPIQISGVGVANSYFGRNESITAQVVAAPDKGFELTYGSLTYAQPVGSWGTVVSASGSITLTDPGFDLSQFDVNGTSKSMSLKADHPIIRSRSTNLSASAVFDWRNVTSKNNIEPTRNDRLRVLRAGIQAEFLDRLLGVAVNSMNLQVSQGLNIFGSSAKGDANMTRAAGDPTFTKANFQIQRLQRVTGSVNLLLEGRGQLSNNPLLSSEEFGLGGMNSVRGYDPSETVGDDGIGGKIELQWTTPAKWAQIFGFLDSGTVWNQDATTSDAKRNSLSSTGIGARLDLPMEVEAEIVAAQPLHRRIQTKNDRDPQYFFSLNKKF